MFITHGKVNTKYLLIVAILAVIVGGVLWYVMRPEVFPTEFPEIHKPEKPEELVIEEITKMPTIAGLINDSRLSDAEEIYILDEYAYITGREILTIVDISNLQNPIIVSSISDPKLIGGNGLSVSGKYAYVLTGESLAAGRIPSLTIIDVSNPTSPTIVGSISNQKLGGPGGIQGIHVLDNYAYIVSESRFLTIIDVSNPEVPKIIGSVSVSDPKILSWPYKIFVSEKYAYIASWGVGAETLVVDVSNPKTPTVVGRVSGPKAATDIYVVDKYAYVIGMEDILAIIDISDPTAPEIVGSIKDSQLESASGIYISGKYAYVSERMGLVIIDVSNPEKPVIVISVSDQKLEGAEDPYILGRYVYLPASNANNLAIIDLKGEIVFSPKPISVLSEEIFKLKEESIEKNEREIAFIQNGDVWILSKDLEKKYRDIDAVESITDFSLSPDGKLTYWLNEKGEIWKKDEYGEIESLVTVGEDMKEDIQEGWGDFESFSYLKGKVTDFYLSPDGKYIAYETLEGHTGCCAGPPNIPVTWIRIMKNDGTEKVKIEKPSGVRRPLMFFDGWLPDSKKILFHFQAGDEPTSGSPLFEVGVDGVNPKVYDEIFQFFREGIEISGEDITPEDLELFTMMLVGTKPVYSPTGEKVAYIKEGSQVRLKDINSKASIDSLEKTYIKRFKYFKQGVYNLHTCDDIV